jgi:hypothetical protein
VHVTDAVLTAVTLGQSQRELLLLVLGDRHQLVVVVLHYAAGESSHVDHLFLGGLPLDLSQGNGRNAFDSDAHVDGWESALADPERSRRRALEFVSRLHAVVVSQKSVTHHAVLGREPWAGEVATTQLVARPFALGTHRRVIAVDPQRLDQQILRLPTYRVIDLLEVDALPPGRLAVLPERLGQDQRLLRGAPVSLVSRLLDCLLDGVQLKRGLADTVTVEAVALA